MSNLRRSTLGLPPRRGLGGVKRMLKKFCREFTPLHEQTSENTANMLATVKVAGMLGAKFERHAASFGREKRAQALRLETAACILSAGRETKE